MMRATTLAKCLARSEHYNIFKILLLLLLLLLAVDKSVYSTSLKTIYIGYSVKWLFKKAGS